MFDLVVLNGTRAGTRFALPDVPAVVGRSPEAHLRIDDPWISNLHALFEPRGEALWVVDLGSRNGTFVGSVQVREAQVVVGALLAFGRTEVRVVPRAAGGDEAEPARTPIHFDASTLTLRATPRPPPAGEADAAERPASGEPADGDGGPDRHGG